MKNTIQNNPELLALANKCIATDDYFENLAIVELTAKLEELGHIHYSINYLEDPHGNSWYQAESYYPELGYNVVLANSDQIESEENIDELVGTLEQIEKDYQTLKNKLSKLL